MATKSKVLVVDDEEINRQILYETLTSRGYVVEQAVDGASAIETVKTFEPDLILLDIMMPVMDGIEACTILKADPKTSMVPIIMVTALGDWDYRIKGIDAGANDFITKPINLEEVSLRVRNAVRSKKMYDQLQAQNTALEELQALRDNLTNMIIHDMRTPLTMILGYLDLFRLSGPEFLDEESSGMIVNAREGAVRLDQMISSILEITQLKNGSLPVNAVPCDLGMISREVLADFELHKGQRILTLQSESGLEIPCDRELVKRLISNLVGNAVKFTSDDTGSVQVSIEVLKPFVEVRVKDNGEGIPESHLESVFQMFTRAPTQTLQRGNGLGLAFCKLVVEAHGGLLDVESSPGNGSTFWFRLPLTRPDEA